MKLLGIYSNKCAHKNLSRNIYNNLFIISRTWEKKNKVPFNKWVNKLWSIQKWNIIQRYKETSDQAMKRYRGTLNAYHRSQSEKATYYMILTLWFSGEGKTTETVKKVCGCQGLGGERDEEAEPRGFLWQWKSLYI